jgi:hypothetical protein
LALRTPGFRKQVALYLLAVFLPSAVLAAVTIHMIRQEQELAQRTAAEECTRLAGEVGLVWYTAEVLSRLPSGRRAG